MVLVSCVSVVCDAAGCWLVFAHVTHPTGRDFLPLTLGMFIAHSSRLPHIVALQMLYFANWSLLWVMLAACTVVAGRRLSLPGRGLLGVLLAQLGIYMLAFVFSDWQPYTDHLRTAVDRLLVQAAPLAVLYVLEAAIALRSVPTRPAHRVAGLVSDRWSDMGPKRGPSHADT